MFGKTKKTAGDPEKLFEQNQAQEITLLNQLLSVAHEVGLRSSAGINDEPGSQTMWGVVIRRPGPMSTNEQIEKVLSDLKFHWKPLYNRDAYFIYPTLSKRGINSRFVAEAMKTSIHRHAQDTDFYVFVCSETESNAL